MRDVLIVIGVAVTITALAVECANKIVALLMP